MKSFYEGIDGQIDGSAANWVYDYHQLVLLQKRVCLKLAVLLV